MESLICNSVRQYIKLSEQIRPLATLACCWDVKQPTNNNMSESVSVCLCVCVNVCLYICFCIWMQEIVIFRKADKLRKNYQQAMQQHQPVNPPLAAQAKEAEPEEKPAPDGVKGEENWQCAQNQSSMIVITRAWKEREKGLDDVNEVCVKVCVGCVWKRFVSVGSFFFFFTWLINILITFVGVFLYLCFVSCLIVVIVC